MARCRELKDKFSKWQKTQHTFLSQLVKFRLSTVPTVKKEGSKQINTKSPGTIENDSLDKLPATVENNPKVESVSIKNNLKTGN
jgi:hypothetical protein